MEDRRSTYALLNGLHLHARQIAVYCSNRGSIYGENPALPPSVFPALQPTAVLTTFVQIPKTTAMTASTRSKSLRRFDSPEQEAFLNLWRTYDRLRQLEDELFGQFELTPQQYNALRLLKASHPMPLLTLELAGKLVSRAPDITRLLDKLAERGLITRERPAENRRQVLVQITAAGLELLDRIAGPLRECHLRQLGHLPTADLERLVSLLQAARAPHEAAGPWTES